MPAEPSLFALEKLAEQGLQALADAARAAFGVELAAIGPAPDGRVWLSCEPALADAREDALAVVRGALPAEACGEAAIRLRAIADLRDAEGRLLSRLWIGRPPGSEIFAPPGLTAPLAEAAVAALASRDRMPALARALRDMEAGRAELEAVLRRIPFKFAYWDRDLNCILSSAAYAARFNKDCEEIVGRPMWEVLGEERFDERRAELEAALNGEPRTYERRRQMFDGSTEYAMVNFIPHVVDGAVQGLIIAVTDRTELKFNHDALEAANVRAAFVNEFGGFALTEMDLTSGDVVWDRQMFALFGWTRPTDADPVDLWRRQVSQQDQERVLAAIRTFGQSGRPFEIEYNVIWPDGSVRRLMATARVIGDGVRDPPRLLALNCDVTWVRDLSQGMAERNERIRVTLRSIGDAVITTDSEGKIDSLNPAAEQLTGWSESDARGRSLDEVYRAAGSLADASVETAARAFAAPSQAGASTKEVVLASRSGAERTVETSISPIRSEEGAPLGLVLVMRDVTEKRRLEQEIAFQATHDQLTGLLTRREFQHRLDRALASAANERSEHALFFIDIDQFQLLNDTCGHAAGDRVLAQFARLLGEAARSCDVIARLGGDQFGVLIENCTIDEAERMARTIRQKTRDYAFVHHGRNFRVGASIGVAPVDTRWVASADLLTAADSACRAAKQAGRNEIYVWKENDGELLSRIGDLRWASQIQAALEENRFLLFAQKIFPVGTRSQQIRAETLLRLSERDGRLVSPGVFLPPAERYRLCPRIDRFVLERVLALLGAHERLDEIEWISVNLSGDSLGDHAFRTWALDALAQAGARVCSKLCLEITETVAITDFVTAARFIESARAFGVRVALDDFGSGFASFGYLRKLKVDKIKIDGQFIVGLDADPLNEAAVRSFVDVARILGVATVAEFVENERILNKLGDLGVDLAQGYLLHKPEPIELALGLSGAASRPAPRAMSLAV